jgi:hypothetical protein
MNKEFMERYRTAFLMLVTVVLTSFVVYLAYSKNDINYLERGLSFFAIMAVFFTVRNLIKSFKINNPAMSIEIENKEEKEAEKE